MGAHLPNWTFAENEYVYGLSYSQDGTVLTATIVSSEETERIVRLTLPLIISHTAFQENFLFTFSDFMVYLC